MLDWYLSLTKNLISLAGFNTIQYDFPESTLVQDFRKGSSAWALNQ